MWEDWPDNALLGCVSAHDSDSGVNSELQYTMEKQAKVRYLKERGLAREFEK